MALFAVAALCEKVFRRDKMDRLTRQQQPMLMAALRRDRPAGVGLTEILMLLKLVAVSFGAATLGALVLTGLAAADIPGVFRRRAGNLRDKHPDPRAEQI